MECALSLLAHRNRGANPYRWNYSRSVALLLMAVLAECASTSSTYHYDEWEGQFQATFVKNVSTCPSPNNEE